MSDIEGQVGYHHILRFMIFFEVIITIFFAIGYWQWSIKNQRELAYGNREKIVALNEIEQLTQQEGVSPVKEQINTLKQELRNEELGGNRTVLYLGIVAYLLCTLVPLFLYLYMNQMILRPFQRLQHYASEIAKGNLEVTLSYEKVNIFGAFTWSFDHMRKEILKAKSCEREAIENNKTIIATLSHDIKTPIASIRAYAEGLEANMDTTTERRERYLNVIIRKCDEVTKLTDDLFLHSLSNLDKLQVASEILEIDQILRGTIDEMLADTSDIHIKGKIQAATIKGDEKRIVQVLENIINNARKYAPNYGIELWTVKNTGEREGSFEQGTYEIHIRDHGCGIDPQDMPFIHDKFYRGKNTGEVPGAGLGLFIVKYIMEQMNGSVYLKNRRDGLEVILTFPYLS
jgi:signal transduction histidine kinase